MKRGLLIILSGPSGVGKGTVRKELFKNDDLNLVYSTSMTTRLPRKGEVDGRDYFFVTKEEFLKNLDEGNLLEHCEFVGNYYGTPRHIIDKWRDEGKNVFLEIEINGAEQVLQKCKDDDVVSIFLLPPSFEALRARIKHRRSESDDVINERLNKAKAEMNKTNGYDYVVVNDTVKHAADEIKTIILKNLNK